MNKIGQRSLCTLSVCSEIFFFRARLQQGIDSISAFLVARGLEISTTKSAAIAFTKRDVTLYELSVRRIPIPYVANQNILGLTFDRILTWTPHI